MKKQPSLEEYQKKLATKIENGEVRCPKCGNQQDFMVNALGHVYCNRCYRKLRFFDWK